MSSAKLEQAYSNRQVLVRKIVSGEVVVHFESADIKDIIISHNGVTDLLSKRGVTVKALRASNLGKLVENRIVEIV